MLCDLGADVVKVEPPEGDVTRLWGKVVGGIPGYYHQQNAGKRNICLDLRAAGAVELVLELVAQADILIENFRPDVMPRLGLGYDVLKAVNPRLIMLSISGFGQGGPESRRPAYAPIIHAEAGLLHRGARWSPTGETQQLPVSTADTNASLHGLVATLAAVILRERTGLGQHVDIAMIDATLVTDDNLHYELEDSEETKGLLAEVWPAGPGPILISADFRHMWRRMIERLGMVDPAGKDTPLEEKIRLRREAVVAYLGGLETWDAVEQAMDAMNLAWGEVRAGGAMEAQATVKHRGAIARIDDRAGGTRPIPQSPYRYSAARSEVRGPAPHRGEHNAQVLAEWLGRGEADVAALSEAGVLLRDAAQ
jgi:crotonobetainyl-CoA:carnitine CoA-transferase CaiB-like acyl-CoA transferase